MRALPETGIRRSLSLMRAYSDLVDLRVLCCREALVLWNVARRVEQMFLSQKA